MFVGGGGGGGGGVPKPYYPITRVSGIPKYTLCSTLNICRSDFTQLNHSYSSMVFDDGDGELFLQNG